MKQTASPVSPSEGALQDRLRVLDALEEGGNVSQRSLGQRLGLSASRVNRIIRGLVAEGQVEVNDSARPFAYHLTEKGRGQQRRLAYARDGAVVQRFRAIQARILRRLQELRAAGVRRLVLYGAGRIMEVTLPLARALELEVVAIVDDDPEKHGLIRGGILVRSPQALPEGLPADILVTTYRHADEIIERMTERDTEIRIWEL